MAKPLADKNSWHYGSLSFGIFDQQIICREGNLPKILILKSKLYESKFDLVVNPRHWLSLGEIPINPRDFMVLDEGVNTGELIFKIISGDKVILNMTLEWNSVQSLIKFFRKWLDPSQ